MGLKPPVFIVGSPRSGTTWLYHILLSSGGFAIYRTEAKVYTHLGPRFSNFRSRSARERFLAQWLGSEAFRRSGLDARELSSRVREACASPGDVQRVLLEGIAARQGAERWSDCTPENLLLMPEIKRDFPDARFIHIVRDGRDVALSLGRQGWIPPLPWDRARPFLAAAVFWDWMVGRGRAAARGLAGAYHEVRYEELVARPQDTCRRLGEFLDHELDYESIRRRGIGTVRRPNTSFAADGGGEGFQPVARWKSRYRAGELELVERLIGRRLTELGYETATMPAESARTAAPLRARLYRLEFATRFWLRRYAPAVIARADPIRITETAATGKPDPTLRPADHVAEIRRFVTDRESPGLD